MSSGRRRVVLVAPNLFWHWMVRDALSDDYDVSSCSGPEFVPDGCPLMEGRTCPLLEEGDIIVTGPDSGQLSNHEMQRIVRAVYPHKPIITFVTEHDATGGNLRRGNLDGIPFDVRHLHALIESNGVHAEP